MNIEQIKEAFDECRHVTTAHWVHGLYTGRTIEWTNQQNLVIKRVWE